MADGLAPDLSRPCLWCGAATGSPCVVVVDGVRRPMSRFHLVRKLPTSDDPTLYPVHTPPSIETGVLAVSTTLTMTGVRYDAEPEDFLEDVMAYRPILPVSSLPIGSSSDMSSIMPKIKIDEKTLTAYIRKNPDQRHEQIAAGLGTDTATTGPLLRALVATSKVKTTGERRATRYTLK